VLSTHTDNNPGEFVPALLFGAIYCYLDRFGGLIDVADHSALQSVAVGHSGTDNFNGLTSWIKCRDDHTYFCGTDIQPDVNLLSTHAEPPGFLA
jgi:hypothetical protein